MLQRGKAIVRSSLAVAAVICCGCQAPPVGDFFAVAVAPSNPHVLYAMGQGAMGRLVVYRTDDGGGSWSAVKNDNDDPGPPTSPLRGGGITSPRSAADESYVGVRVAVSPADPNVVLAGSTSHIYRSEDGGKTWTTVDPGRYPDKIRFHPFKPDTAYVVSVSGVFTEEFLRSDDGGRTFADLNAAASPSCQIKNGLDMAFHPTNQDRLYAATSDGIALSSDGGRCWTTRSDVTGGVVVASRLHPGQVFWVGGAGVFSTADDGQTFTHLTDWTRLQELPNVPPGLGNPGVLTASLTLDEKTLLVDTIDLQVLGIDTQSGQLLDLSAALARRADGISDLVVRSDGALFVAANVTCKGAGGILRSDDGGKSWRSAGLDANWGSREPSAFANKVPGSIIVYFFRDVSPTSRERIYRDHGVAREEPYDPLSPSSSSVLFFNDQRSTSDLVREFEALDEVDCVIPSP